MSHAQLIHVYACRICRGTIHGETGPRTRDRSKAPDRLRVKHEKKFLCRRCRDAVAPMR